MRLICALLPMLVLTGCSSFPADPEHLKPVPADRLLGYQEPLEKGGTVAIERDFGGMGAGCYIAFKVDYKVAARIGMGEAARFQVPVGTRVVGIGIDEQDDTLCGMGRLRRELAVPVQAGGEYFFRIESSNSSGFDILPEKTLSR
ncbi:3-isopropylmalate dehydratase [Pseudomonas sp. PDM14]|uniref:3-isopropylmalate dehydratase n=1 Tax=Pseudomonas sp. PDM14 TaxID=2769288 RepID=UPI001784696D|nr:3-isopropylmalate dehydratase [Pseudomonas sp. PDM14]MBD9484717.1 3-isopropylmalate dehydratase [Pseudomonas sp. PDM14]